jgi:hypothetical protein
MIFKGNKKVTQGGKVGVVPGPHILKFHHQGVQARQHFWLQPQGRFIGTVEGDKFTVFKTKAGVDSSVIQLNLILEFPKETMFGDKDPFQVPLPVEGFKEIFPGLGVPGSLVTEEPQLAAPDDRVLLLP